MTFVNDFDGWDPLTEHYNDESSKKYLSGAGAKMQSADSGQDNNRYVLWVHPLDSRHTEDSLKNIFSHYGEVIDVRIIYPRDGNIQDRQVYGFVTFKSQGAATNAVRGFNDSDKFDFKVSFSNSNRDRSYRNRNQGNSSRNYNDSGPPNRTNRDRPQYSSNDEHVSNVNGKEDRNSRTTTCEPDFDFKTKDRSRHSTTNRESVDNFSDNSKKPSLDQNVSYNRPRDNVKSSPRLPSTGSPSTSSSCNANNRTVATEHNNMETAVVSIKTETPCTTSFIKPGKCCFCSKKTFNVCKECRQNFCHAQCSLDGWRLHTGDECIKVAELIYFEGSDSRNTSVDIAQNASLTNSSTPKTDSKPVYASDFNSPATEYKEFTNLARDYTTKANVTFEDTPPKIPIIEPVVDNNYDDNSVKEPVASNGVQQDQPPAYQQTTPHTHKEMGNDQERNKHDDRNGASNNYDRNGGKNFRPRDNRDGANDNDRSSGDARNFSSNANRSYERKPYDNAPDSERNGGGNRNYSRDSNRDRDGYSGPDRRRNFNDRPYRRSNDMVDNASSPDGATKPYRGSYQNDRNDAADHNGDYDGGAKPRGGYQNRYNAQGRNGGYPNYNENNVNFKGNTSFDRDSRKQAPLPNEVKQLEPNKIFNVTIVSINQAMGSCYVRIADNEGIFQNMSKSLNSEHFTPLRDFGAKTKCVALYKNVWHRGIVQSTNPLRFYLIDVGVESQVDEQSLRSIPTAYVQYRPFAWHVTLANVPHEDLTQWLSENKLISIKATCMNQAKRCFEAEVVPFEQKVAEARKECDEEQRSPASLPKTPTTAPVPPPAAPVPSPAARVESKPKDTGETLQQGVPSEVIVTFLKSENEFFVAVKNPLIELSEKLAGEDIASLSPFIDFQDGGLAMAQFLGDWYRVKVLGRSPVKVQVYFIDYGNKEVCEAKTLKALPDSYKTIPPLAIEVKLYRGTLAAENVTDNALITITPLKMENDSTWLVAVGDKSKDFSSIMRELQTLSLSTAATQPTPPATPKPRVNVDFIITFAVSKSEVYGVFRSNGKLLESVANIPTPSTQLKTAPVLNKIYAKDFEGLWCRARVISVNPIKIYFIDYGNSEECTIDQLFEIPEELQNNPPPLAVKMVLEKESKEILEYGAFVSVSWDQENDTYLLLRDAADSSGIPPASIVNVVSALGDSNYAVILEENRNVYKYINREINANVDQLRKPKKININDLCLGIYEDQNWHRAKIINKSPLTIHFLDFGDDMKCTFDQIKEIPESVAKIPPLAFKVKTEEFVVLEEGSEVKITMIEELEHNYWKVATIKERDRSRVEIISDPKHIEKFTKKKAKASSSSSIPTTSSQEAIAIDDDIDDRRVMFRSKKERDDKSKTQTNIQEPSKEEPPKSQSSVKSFDESSLVFTRLSNIPKNYAKTVTTLSNGVENLSLIEPKRNSTFYDINVPIANHLLDMLRVDDKCVLIIHESLSDHEYSGMVICKRLEEVVESLDEMEKSAENAEPISAKMGDLVLTHVPGVNCWHRAYVVSEPTNVDQFYLLILFDVGMMYRSDEVYRLNDEYRDVPQLSVRINIVNFEPTPDDVSRLEIYQAELKTFDGDCFEGELSSQFTKSVISRKMQLSKWRPTREEVGLKHVPVMNGDIVKVSSVCSTSQYYVVPTEDSIFEQRNDFLSSVVDHCKKSESISGDLKVNDIVGVPYMQSYYRAQIILKIKDSYKVRILDTGNEVTTINSNSFKPLPDNLKFADCYAVLVQLHNVPCTDFNQHAELFLKYIVTHEVQFTLEINESSQLIELICNDEIERWNIKKGDKMNDLLNFELLPGWKKPDFDFDGKYYMNQLKFEEWAIGSELSLFFTEYLGDNVGMMINRYGDTYSKITQVNLNERLREYAEEMTDSYVPIKNELCIAKYEDNLWCRAVCTHSEPGKDLELQFIDIGYQKVVSHLEIRRMLPEFLKHPAASMVCKIINYKDCEKVEGLVGSVLKKCIVIDRFEEGGYSIRVIHLSRYTYTAKKEPEMNAE
ncbi:uncharacterized protein LOC135848661 isoform X2 [Planococcus citri]|uniref:uncharacterized protein LOC135848661 isoform X2 n=1 Tax=Planococcus citri TaxID=170843 RepID=UPI0031F846E0